MKKCKIFIVKKKSHKSTQTINMSSSNDKEQLKLSIEETNALRATLGLKPLRVGGKSKKVNRCESESAKETQKQVKEKEDALSACNNGDVADDAETEKATFLTSSLAESYEAENALSWAEKMRKKKTSEIIKKKATNRAKSSTNNKYSSRHLQGMEVSANLEDIGSENVVLTLKDESILELNENSMASGLNDTSNVLENAAISEKYKAKENLKRKRELANHKSGYSGKIEMVFYRTIGFRVSEANILISLI